MPTIESIPIRNCVLAALSPSLLAEIARDLEPVTLEYHQTLYQAGEIISHVYFPNSGVVSMVATMADGSEIEVGTVGYEGMAGIPVLLEADRAIAWTRVQLPGMGWRMSSDSFRRVIEQIPAFRRILLRYAQALVNLLSQSVACNRLHSVEERAARWLLMTHDRVGADGFPLTHETLSEMLGVRRPSVTLALGALQEQGCLSYRRGQIVILDRDRLEAASCECYAIIQEEFQQLIP